jgi:hypothetical protein
MSTLTTIRRGTKRFRKIIDTAYDCDVYSLSNYFIAEPCNALALVRYANGDDYLGRMGKLTVGGKGKQYTLHVHSNLWFEFRADA